MVAGSTRQFGALPILQATANWYVNAATGSDTAFDGTSPTATGGKIGPFLSIQRAANETQKYNMNGYNQNVHVADGSYSHFLVGSSNGTGIVSFQGNESNPQNCMVTAGISNTHAIWQNGNGQFSYRGFRLSANGAGSCDGLTLTQGSASIGNLRFGPCTRFHIAAAYGSSLFADGGTFTIEAGANAQDHIFVEVNAQIRPNTDNYPALNILGPVNINVFVEALGAGFLQMLWPSMTGKANVHGSMYNASADGIIYTFASGPNYFPGDLPGTTSYGGEYVP